MLNFQTAGPIGAMGSFILCALYLIEVNIFFLKARFD